MPRRLVLLLAFAALTLTPASTVAQTMDSAVLPRNINVPDVYVPWVEALIARSPTLQRQCALIAAADRVMVQLSSGPRSSTFDRARTTFTRDRSGLRAAVFVPVSSDFAELLAHELEHVIEQIEGLNLRRLARHRQSGVRRIGNNVFETARASDAGLAAAGEVWACSGSQCGARVVVIASKD
jgi:hypothetical protein